MKMVYYSVLEITHITKYQKKKLRNIVNGKISLYQKIVLNLLIAL